MFLQIVKINRHRHIALPDTSLYLRPHISVMFCIIYRLLQFLRDLIKHALYRGIRIIYHASIQQMIRLIIYRIIKTFIRGLDADIAITQLVCSFIWFTNRIYRLLRYIEHLRVGFLEAEPLRCAASHNNMIKYRDIHDPACLDQTLCHIYILTAGIHGTARMIVKHHDTAGIRENSTLKYILNRHMCLINIADTHHIEIDGMIGSVQIHYAAILPVHLGKYLCHDLCRLIRCGDLLRTVKRFCFGKFEPYLYLFQFIFFSHSDHRLPSLLFPLVHYFPKVPAQY